MLFSLIVSVALAGARSILAAPTSRSTPNSIFPAPNLTYAFSAELSFVPNAPPLNETMAKIERKSNFGDMVPVPAYIC
jgi:hypothetical protein